MDPQAPMVPGAAPDFPFQETAVQRPDARAQGLEMYGQSLMPQTGQFAGPSGVPTPTPMPTEARQQPRILMPPGMSPHFDLTQSLTPPVIPAMQEFAVERYKADWQQTREATERADSRVSGFQTLLDTLTWQVPPSVRALVTPPDYRATALETLDVTSAYFGGSMVDAWNNVKAAAGADFSPIKESWSFQGPEEPMDIDSMGLAMAPDFAKEDLGWVDSLTRLGGNVWDRERIGHAASKNGAGGSDSPLSY